MSNDLSKFAVGTDEAKWMEVIHPVTGDVIEDEDGAIMRIELFGSDSKIYRAAQRSAQEARLKSRSRANRSSIMDDAIEIWVACTKSWEGIADDSVELDCKKSNVRTIYNKYRFIAEQVEAFIEDRGNFMAT